MLTLGKMLDFLGAFALAVSWFDVYGRVSRHREDTLWRDYRVLYGSLMKAICDDFGFTLPAEVMKLPRDTVLGSHAQGAFERLLTRCRRIVECGEDLTGPLFEFHELTP